MTTQQAGWPVTCPLCVERAKMAAAILRWPPLQLTRGREVKQALSELHVHFKHEARLAQFVQEVKP